VDEFLQTSAQDIFAAGDVAQVYDPLLGERILDSLWNPARQQGFTAGLNLTGCTQAYIKGVPFNVTRLAGLTTTIIGMVGPGRGPAYGEKGDLDVQGIARGDSETWRQLPNAIAAQTGFAVNRLRILMGVKTLLGALVMGDQSLSLPLEQLITAQVDISAIRQKLLAANAPLADILADFYTSWRAAYDPIPQP
jgi:NAD(P)H-nitrite reductase large subunit